MAQQKHDNGSVDWGRVGLETAIGAIPVPGGAAKGAGAIGREATEQVGEQAARPTSERQLGTISTDAAKTSILTVRRAAKSVTVKHSMV